MALSLIAVMVIASLGAGLIGLQSSLDKRHQFSIDRRRALYLAEAGVAEAALAVTLGKSGVLASEEQPAAFGNGVYWVEADDLPDDRVILRCTAQVASAEFVVRSMVLPNVNPVTRLGVFGTDGVSLGWGTTVDGYHSGRGDYASQVNGALAVLTTGELGLVGSDADVVLEDEIVEAPVIEPPRDPVLLRVETARWEEVAEAPAPVAEPGPAPAPAPAGPTTPPTYVFGELRPGKDGFVRSSGLPVLVGEVRHFEAPPMLPEVALPTPDELIASGITVTSAQTGIGMTMATHVTGVIAIHEGATLTINGPKVLRCGSIIVSSGGALRLDDTDGPIQIYAENGLSFREGSILQSLALEPEARGTYFLVPGLAVAKDRVVLEATGTFHGALYAPDDLAHIPASLRWLGSVVARVVTTAPGARVTVDRRLGIGGDGFPALPRQLSWQVVPLGEQVARRLAIDPLLALTMRGVVPTSSASAFIETDLEIQYMDVGDQAATYTGTFASFDPTVAKRIVGARWEDPRDGEMRSWSSPAGSESTGAVEALREDLRMMRKVVLDERPGTDVTTMSDDETVAEAAGAIPIGDIATAPVALKRAVDRVDTTQPDMDPSPSDRAIRAAREASDYANKAVTARDTAVALTVAPLSVGAQTLFDQIQAASTDAATAAANSAAQARASLTAVDAALIDAANAAERWAATALQLAQTAETALTAFQAAI